MVIDWAIKSGIQRVVIGTAAVENPQMMAQAVATWGADAIALGIDADAAGDIKIHGWQSTGNVQATALAIQMRQLGVRTGSGGRAQLQITGTLSRPTFR